MKASNMSTSILMAVTPKSQALRRTARLVGCATILMLGLSLATAGPAGADVPDGWSDPAPVSPVRFILTFIGIPVLITIGILLAVYLPAVIRGESVAPAGAHPDDLWFGGRRDTAELTSTAAAVDGSSTTTPSTDGPAEGDTGGASGTW
jgi:hypothetical protein